jgi:hypothetical protein
VRPIRTMSRMVCSRARALGVPVSVMREVSHVRER